MAHRASPADQRPYQAAGPANQASAAASARSASSAAAGGAAARACAGACRQRPLGTVRRTPRVHRRASAEGAAVSLLALQACDPPHVGGAGESGVQARL